MTDSVPWLAHVLAALTLLLLAVAGYAYLGYPIIARWFVPVRRVPESSSQVDLPLASVLIAARNEAGVIGERIRNLLEQDYPPEKLEILVISDASEDGTDEIVRGFLNPRIRFFRQPVRGGKTAAINRLAPEARGEILVQTDANVMFAKGAVRGLAAAFQDPKVGVVLGEVSFTNADEPQVAGGEGLYWRLESWTKRVEAERGLLAVANGGIYALRRSLWCPLPPDIQADATEPLLAAMNGFHTVIAKDALAFERAAATMSEEYQRKVRIIANQVAGARWIQWRRLPLRIAWAYFSHKLLRYAVPFLWGGALISGAAAGLMGAVWGGMLALVAFLPILLGPLGLLPWPGILGKVFRVPGYLIAINVAAVAGLWRGFSGKAPAFWEPPASTRETAGPTGPRSD